MPFLVWHSSLGSRFCVTPERCPHLSPAWSATPQKCPPITSCLFITSTTCTEPEVSRTQLRLPLFLENSAKKSLPPAPRYSTPLAFTTEMPNASGSALTSQEVSWTPSRSEEHTSELQSHSD